MIVVLILSSLSSLQTTNIIIILQFSKSNPQKLSTPPPSQYQKPPRWSLPPAWPLARIAPSSGWPQSPGWQKSCHPCSNSVAASKVLDSHPQCCCPKVKAFHPQCCCLKVKAFHPQCCCPKASAPKLLFFPANLRCHFVQLQAHLPGEGNPLVLVLPWSKNQKAPCSAGVEILMPRLGKGVEPPRRKENQRQPGVKGGSHHS